MAEALDKQLWSRCCSHLSPKSLLKLVARRQRFVPQRRRFYLEHKPYSRLSQATQFLLPITAFV